jgi:hypothetical protein
MLWSISSEKDVKLLLQGLAGIIQRVLFLLTKFFQLSMINQGIIRMSDGPIAQLVERFHGMEEARSSNLLGSTIFSYEGMCSSGLPRTISQENFFDTNSKKAKPLRSNNE